LKPLLAVAAPARSRHLHKLEQWLRSDSRATSCVAYSATGESETSRALQLVFSDDLDTASWLTSAAVLEVAKRADIVVYAVATAGGASPFLRDLSAFTGGSLIRIGSPAIFDRRSCAFLRSVGIAIS